jgi:hypothetical protein
LPVFARTSRSRSEKNTVLSFETVHALTGCLLAADAGVPPESWGAPATLLLIQDRPVHAHDPGLRAIRAVPVSLAGEETTARPGGLPGILHQVAAAVSGDTPHPPLQAVDLNLIAAHLTEPVPQLRLLGWAVRYNDVHTDDGDVYPVGRVDAVDIDGRVYQLTHLGHEPHPVIVLDEEPDPDDLPATQPGLAALVAATRRIGAGQARA